METEETVAAKAGADDEVDLRSWLTEIGSKQQILIKIHRRAPRVLNGVAIEGYLDTFNELIDENMIRERWGGGTYHLVIHKQNAKGRMPFYTARTIKIGGTPKVEENGMPSSMSSGANGGTDSNAAISSLQWMAKQALDDKREAEKNKGNSSGLDPALLEILMAPMREQVRILSDQLNSRDRDSSKPEGPTFQDQMLGKMLDGESARIEAIRTQHDSEMRQIRERHQMDLDRERDWAKTEIHAQERRHERELDSLKSSLGAMSEGQKIAYENRIDTLKSENKRLQDDITTLKVELAELRSKKDKSLPEQASEIVAMQEALTSLGIGGNKDDDDEKGKSMIERLASRVLDNPEAIGDLVGRARGAMEPSPEQLAAAQAQEQQQLAAAQAQAMAAQPKRRLRKKRPAEEKSGPSAPKLPKLNPMEVEMAITFIESAISNGKTTPEDFAASARSAIPADILGYIEKVGVDAFIQNNVELAKDSPLRTQKGRTFIREVARILLEGQ